MKELVSLWETGNLGAKMSMNVITELESIIDSSALRQRLRDKYGDKFKEFRDIKDDILEEFGVQLKQLQIEYNEILNILHESFIVKIKAVQEEIANKLNNL